MRFAKDALIGIDLDTALSGFKRSYEESQNMPANPSFNADDLEMTPEMIPGPYHPRQDIMRDKYIRENPRSGIARLHGGEELQAFNPYYPGGRPTGTGLFSMLPGLVATQDTSGWPSINRPAPRHEPVYKYDKHMDMKVPNIPVKQAYIAPFSLPKDLENAFAKKHHGIMYDF